MPEMTWSHLTADTVEQWADLTNELARADQTQEFYEAEDLAEELTEAGMTPATDTWAAWDGDTLIAYGQLRVGFTAGDDGEVRLQIDGGVRPQWRGRGIGRDLMDRAEARAAALNAERNPGSTGLLRVSAGLEGSSAYRMLKARGYLPVRYFTLMERDNPGEPLDVDWAGLASPTPEDEEAVRVAHNAAFTDHWGFAPWTSERWHDVYAGRPARPQVSTISRRDDGSVDAYVLVSQYEPKELWVGLVGTIREARGTGLATRALARSLELARDVDGITVVGLDVDSESPTGATRLYERLGFVAKQTTVTMTRPA